MPGVWIGSVNACYDASHMLSSRFESIIGTITPHDVFTDFTLSYCSTFPSVNSTSISWRGYLHSVTITPDEFIVELYTVLAWKGDPGIKSKDCNCKNIAA